MIPLIDADVLRYEIGFAAETGWKKTIDWKEGEEVPIPPFDYVAELLDSRIEDICKNVNATFEPILFLTGKNNFREKIAKKAVYKGTRQELHKPWHYNNITAYLIGMYNTRVIDGMEADDAICIEQMSYWPKFRATIICTRDKDLRQCPGWHYGWELANQPQFGPRFVDEIGEISLVKNGKKIEGWGMKFFYSQLITGDRVDNIPGLPGNGPVAAYNLLSEAKTIEDMERAVIEAYKGFYGDSWKEEMLEQGQLLYMIRDLDAEGKPIMWEIQYG